MKKILLFTPLLITACGGIYGGNAPVYQQNYYQKPYQAPTNYQNIPVYELPQTEMKQHQNSLNKAQQKAQQEALLAKQKAQQEALVAQNKALQQQEQLANNRAVISKAEQEYQATMENINQNNVPEAPKIQKPKTEVAMPITEEIKTEREIVKRPENNKPEKSNSGAVSNLLQKASDSIGKGDLDGAVAHLEAAQRLSPNNSKILYDIANVRYHQERYKDAEAFAGRAVRAGGSNAILKKSWSLIADARKALGDNNGALSAAEKAASY